MGRGSRLITNTSLNALADDLAFARHQRNWAVHLPMSLAAWRPARIAELRAAAQDVFGRQPVAPGPDPQPLYQPLERLLQLPASAPQVLGICGKPRTGKDVIADYLVARYRDVQRMAFSDLVIAEVNSWLAQHGYRGQPAVHRITAANKSELHLRRLLQVWGIGRDEADKGYWARQMRQRVADELAAGARLMIVTGVRLPADVEALEAIPAPVWRAVRPGNDYVAEHDTEAALDELDPARFTDILNPVEGDLAPYEANIERQLRVA